MKTTTLSLLIASLLVFGAGCEPKTAPGPGPKTEDPGEEHGGHAHKALYGGELIEVGDHFANIELVCDGKAGSIDIYVLDAHAENPLRPAQKQLTLELQLPSNETKQFQALAIASSLTGETSESSSHFKISDPSLRSLKTWQGRVLRLAVKGQEFKDISFKISS